MSDDRGYGPARPIYQQVDTNQLDLWRSRGQRRVMFGVLWLIAGVLITLITLANATRGGSYIIAFGPILYGIYKIVSGARMASRAGG